MKDILDGLTRQGYELAYEGHEYRQGKEMVKVDVMDNYYYDVFHERYGSTSYRLVIELLFKDQKPTFRVHLQVPSIFRVVNPWRDLEGTNVNPILGSIEELKLEMRRELVELDCI